MAGALALFGVMTVRRAEAADCAPVAVVEGAGSVAERVRALLQAHGVASNPDACPARVVRASVTAEPGSAGYTLHIEDALGRTSDRQVNDAETAASLVESWALPEAEGLFRPRSISRLAPPVVEKAAPRTEPTGPVWRLAGTLEVSAGTDRSLWYGGAVSGCGHVSRVCIGGRARIGKDDGIAGPNPDGGDLSRTATELLLVASLPLTKGRLDVAPSVGVGSAWTHAEVLAPGRDSDPVVSDAFGPRLEAAVDIGVTLSRHLSLVGEASAALGKTIASSAPSRAKDFVVRPPFGYLRLGIGCQYSP